MWLVTKSVREAIESAKASKIEFTADQQTQYAERFEAAGTSRIMAIAGDKAEIHVNGVLTNTPDIFAMFFGGGNTTYPEIIAAIAEAEQDPKIVEIIMRFDSGGGDINGMFDAMAAMQLAKKPIHAVIGTMAASAAFGLASQADTITASSRASMVGSIGIAMSAFVHPELVELASTHAPKKRPDLSTKEGQAIVIEELDAIHDLFVEGIAEGRGTTVDKVNADFGQGAVLLADKALKMGMIDGIAQTALQSVKSTNQNTASISGEPTEATTMDLTELKAKHPALHAQVVDLGVAQERDRVMAHVVMGTAAGSMDTALKAIEDGDEMTAKLSATYMAAGMNRQDIANRQDDDKGASGADAAAANNVSEEDKEKKQADAILAGAGLLLGMEVTANA